MNEVLYHHGVKGMKWGVRRFQRKDGSLTNLGRKHRGLKSEFHSPAAKERAEFKAKKKAIKEKVKAEARKEKQQNALAKYEQRQRLRYQGKKNLEEKAKSADNKTSRMDISKLSNQELRSVVERMDLERRYSELTTPKVQEKKKKGSSWVKKEMGVVGDIIVKKVATQMITNMMNSKQKNTSNSSNTSGSSSTKTTTEKPNSERQKSSGDSISYKYYPNPDYDGGKKFKVESNRLSNSPVHSTISDGKVKSGPSSFTLDAGSLNWEDIYSTTYTPKKKK